MGNKVTEFNMQGLLVVVMAAFTEESKGEKD